MTIELAGIHHLKLPVADLARSQDWYRSRLGYATQMQFKEHGTLMGVAMGHPQGGPPLALRLDPDLARRSAGFDFFAVGVPDEPTIHALADMFTDSGDNHAGVQRTPIGWVLTGVHDPDGHEVRFYADAADAPRLEGRVLVREG